jgi:hypothetical protein
MINDNLRFLNILSLQITALYKKAPKSEAKEKKGFDTTKTNISVSE